MNLSVGNCQITQKGNRGKKIGLTLNLSVKVKTFENVYIESNLCANN